ncbi:MAG: hypothetical protein KC636_32765, partial [Myxococcales bacterium]|nr:hypothetical protein [Myxococcales bacterium]
MNASEPIPFTRWASEARAAASFKELAEVRAAADRALDAGTITPAEHDALMLAEAERREQLRRAHGVPERATWRIVESALREHGPVGSALELARHLVVAGLPGPAEVAVHEVSRLLWAAYRESR